MANIDRIFRGEWSVMVVLMDCVRIETGLLPDTMDNEALKDAILRSKYTEIHPRDNNVVRVIDANFWADLVGVEVLAHDARTRLGD